MAIFLTHPAKHGWLVQRLSKVSKVSQKHRTKCDA